MQNHNSLSFCTRTRSILPEARHPCVWQGEAEDKTKRAQGPPGGRVTKVSWVARAQRLSTATCDAQKVEEILVALARSTKGDASRRPQVLRTYSERLTTGRITRKTKELMVVTKKKIQNRMRSTAMAMTRHSLRRFLSASWLSWRLRRTLSARTISSCARLVPRAARLGL